MSTYFLLAHIRLSKAICYERFDFYGDGRKRRAGGKRVRGGEENMARLETASKLKKNSLALPSSVGHKERNSYHINPVLFYPKQKINSSYLIWNTV